MDETDISDDHMVSAGSHQAPPNKSLEIIRRVFQPISQTLTPKRPPVAIGKTRIEWHCKCGHQIYVTLLSFVLERQIDFNEPSRAITRAAVAAVDLPRTASLYLNHGTRTPIEKASNLDFQLISRQKINLTQTAQKLQKQHRFQWSLYIFSGVTPPAATTLDFYS
ncbi:hypothetical protein DSL72_003550 [Monilinia vaccinii-corymbosi]|uniref:Uncharacterized protein n=1 Tax=Monilinia vaccinii-corymbosi TaxID=61207 RepID=A0A8A3NY66_9HELO|nr:hypothetical protein DSL72_003550 [Monilinia vaccinii-corymbosi]